MPAGWVAAGTALVGAAASYSGAKKTAEATEDAAARSGEASKAALRRSEEAFGQAEGALSPYARQEQAASTQLMAQMGLAAPQAGGGGGWGFGAGPPGQNKQMDSLLEDLLAEQIAIAVRQGHRGKHGSSAISEGTRKANEQLREMQAQGQIPSDYQIPSMSELSELGNEVTAAHGGYKSLGRSDILGGDVGYGGKEYGADNAASLAQRYFPEGGNAAAEAAAEGRMGEPAAPQQAQTAGDIMQRAGVEGLPPELQERYAADLMEDPRTDPELAAYLGLTPESMDVSGTYQDSAAYQGAIEAGTSAVNQGAAGSGSLYSGRRGTALRDVGQEVEQGYYMDAANRRESMMGARRGERAAGIGRRGLEVGQGRDREQSYYNNYMQMLTSLSSPQTTTNIESMRMGAAQAEGANLMGTARDAGNLGIAGANAQQAGMADIASGVMNMGSSWIDRPQSVAPQRAMGGA